MGFSAASETETEIPPPPLQSMSAKPHPPLHNFSLPLLKWGSQRFLRCMKTDPAVDRDASQSNGSAASPTRPPPAAPRKPSTPASLEKLRTPPRIGAADPDGESVTDDGIEEIRERLLDHLRSAADKMRFRVPEEEESAAMPWNLRTRRAANKAPAEMGSAAASFSPPPPPPPPPPVVPESQLRSMRSRSAAAAAAAAAVQKEKPKEKRKLTVALSKEEIEEDFLLMTGSRPARRPKKRLGKVQRQLDVRNFLVSFLSFLLNFGCIEKGSPLRRGDVLLPSLVMELSAAGFVTTYYHHRGNPVPSWYL